jgi:hypothetical protein
MYGSGARGPACEWCGVVFAPRQSGGTPQRFCSATHRNAYHTAVRLYGDDLVRRGVITMADLKAFQTACTLQQEAGKAISATHLPGNTCEPF